MTQLYPEPRVFTPSTFYRHTVKAFRSFPIMLRAQRKGLVTKAFQERIMLAVTEVNGCKYCNYYHTRLAMKEGISKEEIRAMRTGKNAGLPEDEALALIYAQHYADTGGKPDPENRERLISYYGLEKARAIEASIRAITVGNIYGIAVDGLMRRFRGKKMKDSKLSYELGITLGSLLMFPICLVNSLFPESAS
jgi:AhpD family alkylhydroperoxidase